MSALKNQKHEQFCQLLFEGRKFGWTQGICYMKAGFRSTGHGAEVNAARLLKKTDIRARLAELNAPGARRARLTAADAIEKLDRIYDGAVVAEQYSAAGRAVETQSKISGLMVERHEIGGPGAFSACESTDQVVDQLLAELSTDDALAICDEMREKILARASTEAIVVSATPSRRIDESSSELIKTMR